MRMEEGGEEERKTERKYNTFRSLHPLSVKLMIQQ